MTKKTVAKRKAKAKKPACKAGFFVYVLRTCDDGRAMTYVGWTTDIEQRLKRHNDGSGARTTRGRVWALVHSEKLGTRELAMSREWHLKRDRKIRKKLLDEVVEKKPLTRTTLRSRLSPLAGRGEERRR